MDPMENVRAMMEKRAEMFDAMIDREMDRTIIEAITKVRCVFPNHTNEIAELIALGNIDGCDAGEKLSQACNLTAKDIAALLNQRVSFEEIIIEELKDTYDY